MSRLSFILCSLSLLVGIHLSPINQASAVNLHPSFFLRHLLEGLEHGHGAFRDSLNHPSSFIPHPYQQPVRKIDSEALKKYVGRYELDAHIIPISTLDVTLENNQLWVKPSVVKKRKLIHRTRTVFIDEIEGTPLTFEKDAEGKIVSLTFVYEGADYVAQKVTLPAPSLKGNTTFRLKGYSDAGIVALAGSFNNWGQSEFIFGKEGGEWVCRIDLEPGKHSYKFIVDGNWMLDPANQNTEDDDYGVTNSFIVVAKNVSPRTQP